MENKNNNNYRSKQENDDQSIDIKGLVFIFLNHWYLFLISVVIALAIGFVINRYKTKVYQTTGTILIKDSRSSLDPTAIMTRVSYGSSQNVENEMAILKSYSLIERVIKKMNIEVTYMSKGRVASKELYKTRPFLVEFDRTVPQAVQLVYNIRFIGDSKIELFAKSEGLRKYDFLLNQYVEMTPEEMGQKVDFHGEYRIGEWIDNDYNRIRIIPQEGYSYEEKNSWNISFWVNSYPSLIRQMSSYSVSPITKESSIVSLSMKGTEKNKIVDFLNVLMDEYVSRGLEKKNLVSENTIEFIDQELTGIQQSLSEAESDLANFRSSNDVMNLDVQSNQVYSNLRNLEKERAEKAVNVKIYKRLQDYIRTQIDDPENLAAPSTMGISDPLLNRLVGELVTLSQTKATQLLTQTEQHPQIVKLNEQIVTTKKTILETVNNLVQNAQMGLDEIDKRIYRAESEIKVLPEKQRQLVNYQRKFNFNDDTYKYLMQRRAEALILRASNTPDNEIIDYARLDRTSKISPRASMNYLIAIIIGLLIPALYLFLKDFFNMSVNDRKDIEKITSYPIIGQVALSSDKDPLVVINSPKAPIAESFRSIRTNVEFLTQGKAKNTILVTGDTQGIGKTFNSINIASIYAFYGKKTVLLGFDMRKPKLFQEFGLTNNVGLSSFFSGKEPIENIIQASKIVPSLDIITSGPIPPNPAELIASEKCVELFNKLKEEYDYIIIDTPPLGLVTDAYLLMRFSDVNIFIVRQGVTNKNIFGSVIKDLEDRNINVSIVINGIEAAKGYGYRYGYGNYRYGYGYGYAYGYGYGKYGENSGYYGESSGDGKKKRKQHHYSSKHKLFVKNES